MTRSDLGSPSSGQTSLRDDYTQISTGHPLQGWHLPTRWQASR